MNAALRPAAWVARAAVSARLQIKSSLSLGLPVAARLDRNAVCKRLSRAARLANNPDTSEAMLKQKTSIAKAVHAQWLRGHSRAPVTATLLQASVITTHAAALERTVAAAGGARPC